MTAVSLALIWDDTDMRILFEFLCKQRTYELQIYHDFRGTVDQLHRITPTVLIIKRSLYAFDDGIDFCRQLRHSKTLAFIPIIIGWADLGVDAFERAYAAGANGCFGRVYDIEGIFTMISALVHDPSQTRLVDQEMARRLHTKA
jgi:DNA-binding response OmpR family regulator